MEHVRDMLGRRLHLLGNVDDLAQQLEKIWQEIPQETFRVLYHSMSRRAAACIQDRGKLGQAQNTILGYPECSSGTVKIYTVQSAFPKLFNTRFLWFRVIEKYYSVEFSAKRGRPSAEYHPLSERHFVDYISPTEKETNRTLQCIICCSMTDSKRKKDNEYIFGSDQGDTPEIMDEILTTAGDLELEVNEDDIEELIMGHEDELTIEDLQGILNEERQEKQRNVSPSEQEEDERGPMPTSAIKATWVPSPLKDLLKKWEAVRAMVLEWHPNQADVSRVGDLYNDNAINYFRKILKKREKQ
ncbi:uncharacterized protein TNCV_898491 [Trichonephila clavipes]|nr:uncharacterized protein TNCV_898491 [Trichonephila clavipes]